MKIENLQSADGEISFTLEGANPAFANSLRRTTKGEIPTLAIENVRFKNNTSGLFDEILAHRLGMIPWRFDPEELELQEECSCEGEGCEKCTVNFKLEGKGVGKLKAKDIESPEGIEPQKPELLILDMKEGQEVSISAEGKLGFGKEHAKWQAANSAYHYHPKIEIEGNVEDPELIAERCPGNVFEVEDGELKVENPKDCVSCYVCEEIDENIKVSEQKDKFIFKVESISGLGPNEIVKEAIKSLNNKVEEFQTKIKEEL